MMKKRVALVLVLALVSLASVSGAETVTFGTYNYEPISWIVLSSDSNYTRLLSEYALECMPFDGSSCEWSTSSLRSWLNNSFLYYAFTATERDVICETNGDEVLIPSLGDVLNSRYGFATSQEAEDSSRAAMGSATAIGNGLYTNDAGYCSYYTRTPASDTALYQVRTNGTIGAARYDRDNVGVRVMIVVLTSGLQ